MLAHCRWKNGATLSSVQVRAEQLTMRVAEVQESFQALRDNTSIHLEYTRKNLRDHLQPPLDWDRWRGKLQTDRDVIMAGHSFGSATTIEAIKNESLRKVFSKGICLDPVSRTKPYFRQSPDAEAILESGSTR